MDEDGIVVRDLNGDFELEEPPSLVVEDPEEIVLDMRQENESELQSLLIFADLHIFGENNFFREADIVYDILQRRGKDLLMLSSNIRASRIVFLLNLRVSLFKQSHF